MNRVFVQLLVSLFVSASLYAAGLDDIGVTFHGFADVRGGARIGSDPNEKDASLGEARVQVQLERTGDIATWQLRSDFLYDDIPGARDLDIEEGTGWLDLREANIMVSPLDFIDIKIGRQILTWGRGDLLFINDMFPKDWQSFFSGRDEEYLKAPSDAVFVSLFPRFVNVDIVYVPRFDSDRYISGDRLSYWNTMTGTRAGRDMVVVPGKPDEWLDDHELSIRLSRRIGGYEAAMYGYYGFWKTPRGMDPVEMRPYFPELSVYGSSLRGGLGKGLLSMEIGYYDSREDNSGDNPLVPNDEIRALVGYEREVVKELTAGIQYYVEYMQDYNNYTRTLPEGQAAVDEDRHVVTLRLTKQAMNQNLVLSMFIYYSPSDQDCYARPIVSYKLTDSWLLTGGANLFAGKEDYTFFGQFEKNNNVYAGLRYSF